MKSKYHIMLQYEHSQSSFLSIGCCADLEDLDDSANHYFFLLSIMSFVYSSFLVP